MIIKHRSELGTLLSSLNLTGEVAEIGVAEGRFSQEILAWNISRLYLIDAWRELKQRGDGGFPQSWHDKNYQMTLDGPAKDPRVTILRGMSTDMSFQVKNSSLDLVYLDGDHSYKGVSTDLIFWWPKLKRGGVLAGHDYLCTDYQVKQALYDFLGQLYGPEFADQNVMVIPENDQSDAGFYLIKV